MHEWIPPCLQAFLDFLGRTGILGMETGEISSAATEVRCPGPSIDNVVACRTPLGSRLPGDLGRSSSQAAFALEGPLTEYFFVRPGG
jgi:hypothetical protein